MGNTCTKIERQTNIPVHKKEITSIQQFIVGYYALQEEGVGC